MMKLKKIITMGLTMSRFSLNNHQLKLIAAFCMMIDHIFQINYSLMSSLQIPFCLVYIGRISFPIFAYCIAEGCKRTNNIKKYIIRLFIFAVITELIYDLAFGIDHISYQNIKFLYSTSIYYSSCNVLFTFTLSALCIWNLEKMNTGKVVKVVVGLLYLCAAQLINSDYGMYSIAFILAIYFVGENRLKLFLCMFLIFGTMYIPFFINTHFSFGEIIKFVFTMLAYPIICLYNGSRGKKSKYIFYFFYPVHLLLLILIREFPDSAEFISLKMLQNGVPMLLLGTKLK